MNHTPLHILLADDDEDDRLIFRDAIQEVKVKTNIIMANDGLQLMEYLTQDGIELPHIIFLDLNMPRKGGIEALKEIRNNERLRDLTVAIYSTSASEEDIEETFVRGANVYIRKPNDFPTLVKVLAEVITINWQYQTSQLNKENFLLRI